MPGDKTRQRYQRSWPLVGDAIGRADTARVWDNSGHDGPVDVALFVAGVPIGACRWPRWTPQPLTSR